MEERITVVGIVGTTPRSVTTQEGLSISSFRLAVSQRKFDKAEARWLEDGTNWYTVTAFRRLAEGIASSIEKGDHVIASGRLRLREWSTGSAQGLNVEIEAQSVGHDLCWGSTVFTRGIAGDLSASSIPDPVLGAQQLNSFVPG